MKRKIIVTIMIAVSLGASAQSNEQLTFPNWYIGIYSGCDAYLTGKNAQGQGNSYFSFDHNVNTLSSLCVGYDVTKVFSARGLLGWTKYSWSPDGISKNSRTAATITGDIMLSIPRLIADYDPYRIVDIQVFLGAGGAYQRGDKSSLFSSGALLSPIVRAGIQGSFFVSRLCTVNLDIATNFVSGRMDDVTTSHSIANYTSVMLGLTYHLVGCQCLKKPHNMAY